MSIKPLHENPLYFICDSNTVTKSYLIRRMTYMHQGILWFMPNALLDFEMNLNLEREVKKLLHEVAPRVTYSAVKNEGQVIFQPYLVSNLAGISPYWSFWRFRPFADSTRHLLSTSFPVEIKGAFGFFTPIDSDNPNFLLQKMYLTELAGLVQFLDIPLLCICQGDQAFDLNQQFALNFPEIKYVCTDNLSSLEAIKLFLEEIGANHAAMRHEIYQPGMIPLYGLEDVYVSADSIGVGAWIAERFVAQVGEQLLKQHKSFRIWFDVGMSITQEEMPQIPVNVDKNLSVLFDDVAIARPIPGSISSEQGETNWHRALHLSLELADVIYDCFKAINGLPVEAYRKRIISTDSQVVPVNQSVLHNLNGFILNLMDNMQ